MDGLIVILARPPESITRFLTADPTSQVLLCPPLPRPDSGAPTLGTGHRVQGHVQVSRQSAVISCVVPFCLSVPLVCVAPLL